MKRLLLLIILMSALTLQAGNIIHDPQIKSLQTVVNQDWLSPAVMRLGSNDVLHICFDELSHDYHHYVYQVEHCEADWTPSRELFESDWLEGFNRNTIDDYEVSINTTVPYTHYWLQIPNDKMRLKRSGNYRLHVYEEELDTREVLTVDFWITEESMPLILAATTNTDIDTNVGHQQVSLSLGYGAFRVTMPTEQIQVVVMQNGRQDNQKTGVKPTIIKSNGAEWQHCRNFIFEAGNEYHKFEVLDVSHTTMGLDDILWNGSNYEAYPFVNEVRTNYLYDEDANGAFYIRNSDNWQNTITCDYVWVTYRLKCPRLSSGHLFIDGQWTTDTDRSGYMMEYDDDSGMYVARILQKQGYYSYQYLWEHPDGTLHPAPSEGSFYQTENRYQAFVYFKGIGESTWRLAAYRQINLK